MTRPDEAPLLGRSAELALLSKAIDEAAEGRGTLGLHRGRGRNRQDAPGHRRRRARGKARLERGGGTRVSGGDRSAVRALLRRSAPAGAKAGPGDDDGADSRRGRRFRLPVPQSGHLGRARSCIRRGGSVRDQGASPLELHSVPRPALRQAAALHRARESPVG